MVCLRVKWLLSRLYSYMMYLQFHLVLLYTSFDLILMSIWSLSYGYCFVFVMLQVHSMFSFVVLLLIHRDHLNPTYHEGF